MANITIGAPLSGIRGTVGGNTFSANGSGPYMKQWARPTNPRSAIQTSQRSFYGKMSGLWRALSGTEKAAWATFAALPAQDKVNSLGETYSASGFNWFTSANTQLLRAALPTIVATPTQARAAAPTIDGFRVTVPGSESDLCTCGTPTASTANPIHPATDAFDDNLGTEWQTLPPNTTGWLQYVLCTPAEVKHLRWHRAVALGNAAPGNWTFEVHDGMGWVVLFTATNDSSVAFEWQDYYFPNSITSDTYRINVSANQGHPSLLAIAEVEFMAGDEGSSVICYPEDDFAASPDYDLVLKVAMSNSTGTSVQTVDYHEVIVNTDPGRWYQLFQDELLDVFGCVLMGRAWYAELYRQTEEGIRSAAATERTETIEG